jgi:hypothetical protein
MKFTPLLLAIAFLAGCASTNQIILDKTPRPPTTNVEVFKDNQQPDRRFKIIAELSYLGPREEELTAEAFFIKQSKALGGDGILFSVAQGGEKGGGLGPISTAWVFLAKVIVWQAKDTP